MAKVCRLAGIGKALGNYLATSIRLGMVLSQGGEFAFVLFSTAPVTSCCPASWATVDSGRHLVDGADAAGVHDAGKMD
jgi:hypothetical protein